MKDTIEQMKQWCLDNYTQGADTMVECWSDQDYADLFTFDGQAKTTAEAWDTLKRIAAVYDERKADAHNSEF